MYLWQKSIFFLVYFKNHFEHWKIHIKMIILLILFSAIPYFALLLPLIFIPFFQTRGTLIPIIPFFVILFFVTRVFMQINRKAVLELIPESSNKKVIGIFVLYDLLTMLVYIPILWISIFLFGEIWSLI